MDFSFPELNYNSVETLPGFEARAAFTVNSSSVFKEDVDIVPTTVYDSLSYIPWGGDNQMLFNLLALVEKDETLATCEYIRLNPEFFSEWHQSETAKLFAPPVFRNEKKTSGYVL